MNNLSYVVMDDYVTIVLDDTICNVEKASTDYDIIVYMLKKKDHDGLDALLNKKEIVKAFIKIPKNNNVVLDGNVLKYKGKVLDNVITSHVLKMRDGGFDFSPMLYFIDNLMGNPSYSSIQELYGFLKKCNMFTLTEDGCFLAYKKISKDYKDLHTGTFDNSIGAIVEMPRREVNDNRHETCSAGLHFCSYSYLRAYGTNDPTNRVVIVKINPRDVVSIPTDYNEAKGRCCRYTVVREVKDYKEKDVFVDAVDDLREMEVEIKWKPPVIMHDAHVNPLKSCALSSLEDKLEDLLVKIIIDKNNGVAYLRIANFLKYLDSKELCEVYNYLKVKAGLPKIKKIESKETARQRISNMIMTDIFG